MSSRSDGSAVKSRIDRVDTLTEEKAATEEVVKLKSTGVNVIFLKKGQEMKARSGFTLVEILIVVVILGILAAIVIPQFTEASTEAKTSSLCTDLQTMRSQIELYKIQHNDALPGAGTASWTQAMTGQTDVAGAVGTDYGPCIPGSVPCTKSKKRSVPSATKYCATARRQSGTWSMPCPRQPAMMGCLMRSVPGSRHYRRSRISPRPR